MEAGVARWCDRRRWRRFNLLCRIIGCLRRRAGHCRFSATWLSLWRNIMNAKEVGASVWFVIHIPGEADWSKIPSVPRPVDLPERPDENVTRDFIICFFSDHA